MDIYLQIKTLLQENKRCFYRRMLRIHGSSNEEVLSKWLKKGQVYIKSNKDS